MEHDDRTIGRILTRREAIALIGGAGMTILAGRATPGPLIAAPRSGFPFPSCVVRPEQTEGPYFVDGSLARSDIRSDPADGSVRDGLPLDLAFRVSRIGPDECAPLEGVLVDVWQCDALGVYSDVRDINGLFDTRGRKFLRGHQLTDASGEARFTTIYPGWYQGRTVHIHFKLRVDPASGRGHEFTSQLYFDDAVSDRVFTRPPYAGKEGRRVRNEQDGIYRRGGDRLTLAVDEGEDRCAATFDVGLDLT